MPSHQGRCLLTSVPSAPWVIWLETHPSSSSRFVHNSRCLTILRPDTVRPSPPPHLTSRVWRALACIRKTGRGFEHPGSSCCRPSSTSVIHYFSLIYLWGVCTAPLEPFPRHIFHSRFGHSLLYGLSPRFSLLDSVYTGSELHLLQGSLSDHLRILFLCALCIA
jgi:hypothetical protein